MPSSLAHPGTSLLSSYWFLPLFTVKFLKLAAHTPNPSLLLDPNHKFFKSVLWMCWSLSLMWGLAMLFLFLRTFSYLGFLLLGPFSSFRPPFKFPPLESCSFTVPIKIGFLLSCFRAHCSSLFRFSWQIEIVHDGMSWSQVKWTKIEIVRFGSKYGYVSCKQE